MTPFRLVVTALAMLIVAAVIGAALAVRYLRGTETKPPARPIPPLHGALGAAGLAVLAVALDRGLPPSTMGTAGFGAVAAVLLGLALVFGLAIAWASCRARRPASAVVAIHASLAIAGLVVLWVLVSLS